MILKRIVFVLSLLVIAKKVFPQCSECKILVTGNTITSYTVNAGEFLCVQQGVNYTGTLTLNGGTICNYGNISNVIFKVGTLNNFAGYSKTGDLTIANTGLITINNFSGSKFNLSGNLTIQSSATTTGFIINVNQGPSSFVVTGDLIASKGSLYINPKTDSKSFGERVFVNIGGQLNVAKTAALQMNVLDGAIFNVNKDVTFDGEFNKSISNAGNFNVNGSFNVGGNGKNTGVVTINNINKGQFNISQNFNSSYTNGTVTVNNNSSLVIKNSWNQTKDNSSLTNNRSMVIGVGLNADKGSITNNGVADIANITLKSATVTNSNWLTVSQDFTCTANDGVISNSGYLRVGGSLGFKGIVNLSPLSLTQTGNFANPNNGILTGLGNPSNYSSYARLLINNSSSSSGYANGKLLICDLSLTTNTSNVNYGFDQVTNGNRISNTVTFVSRGASGGTGPPVIICSLMTNFYSVNTGPNLTSNCPGSPVTLNAQTQQTVSAGNNINTINVPLAYNNYTWQPGNLIGYTNNVYPNTNTTYTVYVKLANGCIISNTILVTVNTPPPPSIIYNGNPFQYSNPTNLTFPVTQTGPGGGSYSSSPSGLALDPVTGVITASASSFGTYTVYYTTPESPNCYSMYTATTVVTLSDFNCYLSVLPDNAKLCDGDQIQFTVTGGVSGYTWTPATGLSCTNCPSPILTFTNSVLSYTVLSERSGSVCGQRTVRILARTDCQDNSIVGCCFSNYGAAVYVNDKNTHINVYCNVLNEISNLQPGPTMSKGKFESYGNINLTKDWIHNGLNDLYTTPTGTTTFFGNIDQNMKGNSNTHFNKLVLGGNGARIIWISEFANSDLDLTSNEFVLQNYYFYMKNPLSDVYRTSGFASSNVNGYFSRYMNSLTATPYKAYLFPLGTKASTLIPFRYRPLEIYNNSLTQPDEVSANFMNVPPSVTGDFAFVNTNFLYPNTVTDKAPSITQVNMNYYHKIKNTVPPPLPPSDLVIKSYYPPSDGAFQGVSEWEKNNLNTYDWWGLTPGAGSSPTISTNAGTFGQKYAMTNGPQTFNGKPYALAISNIYVNTSSFGGSGNVITLTPAPTNTTSVTTNTSTVSTPGGTVVTSTTSTVTTVGGVTTSTTSVTSGTVTTITTGTTSTSGGITTGTTVATTGTVVTVTTTSTAPGPGGSSTNTTVVTTGSVTSTTTSTTTPIAGGGSTNTTVVTTGSLTTTTSSTTTPTVGGVSGSTVTSTSGGTTTTTVSNTVNNGNTSTTSSSVTTVVGASTVVVTSTCVTTGVGNTAVTTCSTQTIGNPSVTVTSNTVTTVGSNTLAANTSTNVYNPGPFAITSNPPAGDYILGISSLNNCDIPGQVKFTVTPGGTISPTNVMYSPASQTNFSVNLSDELYTINNVSVSLTLNSTPNSLLAQCVNSIVVSTTGGSDYVMDQSLAEVLNVTTPPAGSYGNFNITDALGAPIPSYSPVPITPGTTTPISFGYNTRPVGVYHFNFTVTFGVNTETVQGQFIIK